MGAALFQTPTSRDTLIAQYRKKEPRARAARKLRQCESGCRFLAR